MSQNTRRHDQAGSGVVVVVLGLLMVAAIGFVVWKMQDSSQTASNTPTTDQRQQSNNAYTDTAGRFTLFYPAKWSAAFPAPAGKDGDVQPDPDWAKVSRPVLIKPNTGHKDNDVRITSDCTAGDLNTIRANKDRFHTYQDLTINGYTAFYDKLDFKGDAESYLDHTYYILTRGDCLRLTWRQNWHHDMSNTNFDDSQNFDGFMTIVSSIKFNN
jgi:hypothetical protein